MAEQSYAPDEKVEEGKSPTRKAKLEHKPEWVVLFLGSRGAGKSTLMYYNINKISRFLIYDPLDQPLYRQFETYHAGTYRELVDRVREVAKGGSGRRGMKLRYVAYNDSDDEFERICRLVDKAPIPFIFIIEEIASHIRGHTMTKYFYRLVRMSRNEKKGIWLTTQHPKMVPPKLRNNIDVVYCFALWEPESIDYAQKWLGKGYDPKSLEPFGYYMWVSHQGERRLIRYPPLILSRKEKRLTTKKGQPSVESFKQELDEE